MDSVYGLLADPALLKVTQTLLGLPAATGAIDIDKQAAMVKKRLDVADLKDPAKLKKIITHFTALWDVQNTARHRGQQRRTAVWRIEHGIGISGDLLASIQNLRLGGH